MPHTSSNRALEQPTSAVFLKIEDLICPWTEHALLETQTELGQFHSAEHIHTCVLVNMLVELFSSFAKFDLSKKVLVILTVPLEILPISAG